MATDVSFKAEKCSICKKYLANDIKEPLLTHKLPKRPWETIGTDLFSLVNFDYLTAVTF